MTTGGRLPASSAATTSAGTSMPVLLPIWSIVVENLTTSTKPHRRAHHRNTRHGGRHEDWVHRAGKYGRRHGRESVESRPSGNGVQPVAGQGCGARGAGGDTGEVG